MVDEARSANGVYSSPCWDRSPPWRCCSPSSGIYGVIAYSVAQRTQEVGIRRALGAQQSDILRLVMGQGLVLAVVGIAAGIAGAIAVTRVLKTLLFHVSATDPVTFVGVAVAIPSGRACCDLHSGAPCRPHRSDGGVANLKRSDALAVRFLLQKRSLLQFLECLLELLLGVHHDGTVPRDRLFKRLARD